MCITSIAATDALSQTLMEWLLKGIEGLILGCIGTWDGGQEVVQCFIICQGRLLVQNSGHCMMHSCFAGLQM